MASEWKELPFSEAVVINPRVPITNGKVYPFVDMKSLDPSWRDVTASESRSFKNGGSRFMPLDTLMARITPCLENGKIARYYAQNGDTSPAFGSTEFIVIRGKEGVTDNDYAFYLTKSEDFRQFAISQMTGSSGRQRVPVESLQNYIVQLPPLPEQQRIARILGSLDDKIELNRQMNTTLEAMAQAVFKSWFVDFDPVKAKATGQPIGLPPHIDALFPDSFEDSELGLVPKGWRVDYLPSVIEVNPKYRLKAGTIAHYLEMSNMPTSSFRPEQWEDRPFTSGTKFMNGDTLMARITPCLENGKTAYVDFLEEDQIGWGSTEYIVFRSKPGLPPEYTYFLARSESFRNYAIGSMSGTSGRQRVPTQCFDQYLMVIPDEAVVRYFGNFARANMAVCSRNCEESKYLAGIRDVLLPRLMMGDT